MNLVESEDFSKLILFNITPARRC